MNARWAFVIVLLLAAMMGGFSLRDRLQDDARIIDIQRARIHMLESRSCEEWDEDARL